MTRASEQVRARVELYLPAGRRVTLTMRGRGIALLARTPHKG